MRFLDALVPVQAQRSSLAEAYFGAGNSLNPFGLGGLATYSVGGQTYTVPVATTMPGQKAEGIANSFEGYVLGGLAGNSVIFSLTMARLRVLSQARFTWQSFTGGRPGDLFATAALSLLERPWPGGVTSDLLALMELHSAFGGNHYATVIDGQIVSMRPDWVEVVMADRAYTDTSGRSGVVGLEKVGYLYYQSGKQSGVKPIAFLADEVSHFAPIPDPTANYRGMSWLTPVLREIQADGAASTHKLKFFENAATPNLAVGLQIADPTQFKAFATAMDEQHKSADNAYKTLYTGPGADVRVIGQDMKQMDFANVIAAGEVRLASAAGVHPSVAGLSEGLSGSSLNAGNFSAARRQFADVTCAHWWGNACGSLEVIVPPPHGGSRLWHDVRDVAFLREDQKDLAAIQSARATAIRELFMAGFTPDSCVAAVNADDWSLLTHSGALSIQVQTPGPDNKKLPSTEDQLPADLKVANPEVPAPAAAGAPTNGNGATP